VLKPRNISLHSQITTPMRTAQSGYPAKLLAPLQKERTLRYLVNGLVDWRTLKVYTRRNWQKGHPWSLEQVCVFQIGSLPDDEDDGGQGRVIPSGVGAISDAAP
jgi:hypothetical protein